MNNVVDEANNELASVKAEGEDVMQRGKEDAKGRWAFLSAVVRRWSTAYKFAKLHEKVRVFSHIGARLNGVIDVEMNEQMILTDRKRLLAGILPVYLEETKGL